MNRLERQRLVWRSGFFALFVLAPALDIFRCDLTQGHFILFAHAWTLGIDANDATRSAGNIILRGFLPLAALVGLGIGVSWRYGRLYCGWLCPHFSVVETINTLMRRACGKPTLWEAQVLPNRQHDGFRVEPRAIYWWLVAVAVVFFSALWAITLLTYLLPPAEVWGNLLHGTLTRNQALFLGIATGVLTIEFTLARHLFCRFGCAVGLFQSLVWMGNRRALVVGFDSRRAPVCAGCDRSCEHACPMRLRPRQLKRLMFTCTQCRQCVQSCDRVNQPRQEPGLLRMVSGNCAEAISGHGGKRAPSADCLKRSD